MLAALGLVFSVACGAPAPATPAPSSTMAAQAPSSTLPTPARERLAVTDGKRLRYSLQLAEQPNLVYQLDCITGTVFCAQPIYKEFWATLHLDTADEGALATWKTVRARHGGELRRKDAWNHPQPLLAPSGGYDVSERQRIAGLNARTPGEYLTSIALLSTDADAQTLQGVLAHFAPRFAVWWRERGFAVGSAFFDGFQRLLADPFLDATLDKAARFYEADLPPGTTFRIHVVVQPPSSRKLHVAYELEGDAVVEAPEGSKPEVLIDVVAHELFHYFFFRMDPKRQAALLERVTASEDPYAAASFGMFDESIAASLGNGVVGQHYAPPDAFAKALARGFIHYRAAGSVARELFPSMAGFLDQGVTVSSDEFLRAYTKAAHASYAGGRPSPIDYLHSPVSIAAPRFTEAAKTLQEAAWAGFPYLREYASFDAEAQSYVSTHPFMSAAIFLPIEGDTTAVLSPLAASPAHRANIAALKKSARGFVYALPRTNKSYAFLFVADNETTMRELVKRFVSLPPSEAGKLVELSK